MMEYAFLILGLADMESAEKTMKHPVVCPCEAVLLNYGDSGRTTMAG